MLGHFNVVLPKSSGMKPPRGAPDEAGVNRIYRAQVKRNRRNAKRLELARREAERGQ